MARGAIVPHGSFFNRISDGRWVVAVTRLQIQARTPYADGAAFGAAGAYERIDGIVHFAVDPTRAGNAVIVDLDQAPRDPEGRVHFSADVCILQPIDPAHGNRRLLYDVLNRGNKLIPRFFNRARPQPVPSERIEPGDGFLLRRGWTLVWCGWQWDVVRGGALLGLEAPRAMAPGGLPLQGQIMVQFQPNDHPRDRLLADRTHQPYPAADVAQPDAELAVRDWLHGDRTVISRERWRFARDEDGRLAPDDTRVWLDGGFEPGKVYEVVYRTRACPVVGTGLLATRDIVSFSRYSSNEAGNPCAGRIDHAFGFGASQSGRFLRQFLHLGLNLDEAGQQVFDGVHVHIAGGRRGQFNQRFGQPSDASTHGLGHLFPFTDDDQTDPLTGQTDGLLRLQRALGGVPKIVATNTSAEYWRGDASLLHTDLAGAVDVEPPAEVRTYLFAGTQHGGGALPLTTVNPLDGVRATHPFNVVDYAPLTRAALDNLDRWVTAGEEPPPNMIPRLADGTAAPARQIIATFPTIAGMMAPASDQPLNMRRLDFGPDAERGVGRYPPVVGEHYASLVSAVDGDGNEVAGLRLPDVAVPLATYLGWNTRSSEIGGSGQVLGMLGSTLPFPATDDERRRTGDARPSIAARYRDREDYLARVRRSADELAAQRYILAEDIAVVVQSAAERYDAFAAVPAQTVS